LRPCSGSLYSLWKMKKLLKRYLEDFRNLCFVDLKEELSPKEERDYELFANTFEAALGLSTSLRGSTIPHLRIPVFMPVVFTDCDPPIKAMARDVSHRGMFVSTDHPFPIGEEVMLLIYPEENGDPMELSGKIVRDRPRKSEETDEQLIGVAVEISSLEKNEVLCEFFFKLLENAVRNM